MRIIYFRESDFISGVGDKFVKIKYQNFSPNVITGPLLLLWKVKTTLSSYKRTFILIGPNFIHTASCWLDSPHRGSAAPKSLCLLCIRAFGWEEANHHSYLIMMDHMLLVYFIWFNSMGPNGRFPKCRGDAHEKQYRSVGVVCWGEHLF